MNKISSQNSELYGSLISKTKDIKAQKEVGGTPFGAVLLAQSYNLDMMQEAEKILQKDINSVSDINSASSAIKTNLNTDKAYGYSVDSSGFMGADFNKAANLPANFKIHKSTLDEINRYNETYYLFKPQSTTKVFDKLDLADTVKQYYRVFEDVVGKSNKQVYSQSDLAKLPKGFTFTTNSVNDNGNYLPTMSTLKVTNIYKTDKILQEAKSLGRELSSLGVTLSIQGLKFSKKAFEETDRFNADMSYYKKGDGYTKEGVFVGFLKSFEPRASDSGETKLTVEVSAYSLNSILETKKWTKHHSIDFLKIAQDEAAIAELLRQRNKSLAQEVFKSPKDVKKEAKDLMERISALMGQSTV